MFTRSESILGDLPVATRRTFYFHLAYAMFDAAAGGILLNAPMVALKMMSAPNWQLPLRELFVGLGMLATLYLGSWMAPRHKMPFVVVPGLIGATFVLLMPFSMGGPFWFLMFFSVSAMFEITTRPAITAVLRTNYPPTHRGALTGMVRKWSSLSFLCSTLCSALLLQKLPTSGVVQSLMVTAALLSVSAYLCFRQIRVDEVIVAPQSLSRLRYLLPLVESALIVIFDARYRRYLAACFIDGFFGMLYVPLIASLLNKLGYGYLGAAAMIHILPSLAAFVVTGWLGHWLDRWNPWRSWAWIRFAWGIDALLLAATPLCAFYNPYAALLLPLAGRLLRGVTQGVQWTMWWQIGVTHFAPPGADTSRYMGIMVFLNGATRLSASAIAIALTAWRVEPTTLMLIGGLGIIAVGAFSLGQARLEEQFHLDTIADFEARFRP